MHEDTETGLAIVEALSMCFTPFKRLVDGASEPKGTFTIPEIAFDNLGAYSKAIEEKEYSRTTSMKFSSLKVSILICIQKWCYKYLQKCHQECRVASGQLRLESWSCCLAFSMLVG